MADKIYIQSADEKYLKSVIGYYNGHNKHTDNILYADEDLTIPMGYNETLNLLMCDLLLLKDVNPDTSCTQFYTRPHQWGVYEATDNQTVIMMQDVHNNLGDVTPVYVNSASEDVLD